MSVLLTVNHFHNFVILITLVIPEGFKLMNLMVIFLNIIKIEDCDPTRG